MTRPVAGVLLLIETLPLAADPRPHIKGVRGPVPFPGHGAYRPSVEFQPWLLRHLLPLPFWCLSDRSGHFYAKSFYRTSFWIVSVSDMATGAEAFH